MITFKTGDIFESKMQVLVNPVNCTRVMGAGLAKQFRIKFPFMYFEFERLALRGDIRIGVLHHYTRSVPQILNFPTKDHWKQPSELWMIEAGLKTLLTLDIPSIAFPKIGCGLGGLSWEEQVKPMLLDYVKNIPEVEIYERLD